MPQITGHGEKLSRKQEQAIVALLEKPTVEKAAQQAGLAEKTLRLWMKKPEFQKAYRQARLQLVDEAIKQLQNSCTVAAQTLKAIAIDKQTPPASRVSACKGIFDLVFKGTEFCEIVERLDRLEKSIKDIRRQSRW